MDLDIEKSRKVACSMAYHGIAVNTDGSLMPCCQYTHDRSQRIDFRESYKLADVRRAMHEDYVKGVRHAGCQKCYKEEDLGHTTLRNLVESMINISIDTSMKLAEIDDDAVKIRHAEIRLGNLCNLRCMMCTPVKSSSIAVERLQHESLFRSISAPIAKQAFYPSWWETDEFETFRSKIFKNLRWINFSGGEPFMIPQVGQWLDNLADWSAHGTVAVGFNTNLTQLSDEMLTRLTRFYPLAMMISLEGIGPHNDYVRYPSTWSEIDANMDRMLDKIPSKYIGVNHTFQHASVYSLPDLAAWTKQRNILLRFTMVQGFPHLTLQSVPPKDILKLQDWLDNTTDLSPDNRRFVSNALESARFDPDLYQEFRRYVSVLDEVRGTSWDTTFNPSPL